MAALTGNTIASTYKQLLKLTSEGVGADASAKYIEDGLGTDTALSLSTTRVGIGTASPSTHLHVKSTTTAAEVMIESTATAADTNAPSIVLNRNADLTDGANIGTVTFRALDSGGATADYAKIFSEIVDETAGSEDAHICINTAYGADGGGLDRTITIGGAAQGLGINLNGADSPVYALEAHAKNNASVIVGAFYANNHDGVRGTIHVNDTATTAAFYGYDENDGSSPAYAKTFYGSSDGSQGITVDHNGLVGIGTSSPTHSLTIKSSTANSPTLTILNESSNDQVGGNIFFRNGDSDGTLAAGTVIGDIIYQVWNDTANDYQNAAGIKVVTGAATGGDAHDTPGEIQFHTTPDDSQTLAQIMTIKSTGNVGIGVNNPSELLDVNGTVRAKALRLDEAANVNEGTITNTSVAGYSRLKASTNSGGGSTGVLIKGLDGGVEGQVLYIYKTSNQGVLRIYNNSANASAGDRILVPGCVSTDDSDYITIPAGGYGGFTLVYDTSASEDYWHLITSAPNAAITA